MNIDLRQLFEVVDKEEPFSYELDLSSYELFGTKPFVVPVAVRGVLKNVAGIVTLDYTARFTMALSCDRCLKAFERTYEERFEHILVNHLEADSDDFILVEDMLLNVDELVLSDVLLFMPSKILCEDDCKGLCPICGKDLNQGDCGCTESGGDPRFDVLSQLLT